MGAASPRQTPTQTRHLSPVRDGYRRSLTVLMSGELVSSAESCFVSSGSGSHSSRARIGGECSTSSATSGWWILGTVPGRFGLGFSAPDRCPVLELREPANMELRLSMKCADAGIPGKFQENVIRFMRSGAGFLMSVPRWIFTSEGSGRRRRFSPTLAAGSTHFCPVSSLGTYPAGGPGPAPHVPEIPQILKSPGNPSVAGPVGRFLSAKSP